MDRSVFILDFTKWRKTNKRSRHFVCKKVASQESETGRWFENSINFLQKTKDKILLQVNHDNLLIEVEALQWKNFWRKKIYNFFASRRPLICCVLQNLL